jgi:hypothetical protein
MSRNADSNSNPRSAATVSRQSFVEHPVVSSSRVPCTTAPRFSLFSNDHPAQRRLLRTRSRTATDRVDRNPPSFHAFVSKARRPAGSAFTLRYSQCSTAARRSGVASLCQADRFGRTCERALVSCISICSSSRASRLAASQDRRESFLAPLPLQARRLECARAGEKMMSSETSKKSQGSARRRQRIARRPSCTTRCGMRWHVVS